MSRFHKDTCPSDDPSFAWSSKITDTVKQISPIKSFDFLTDAQVGGTHLRLHPKYKYNPNAMKYVGDWNPSASYDVGNVVSVYDNQQPATTKITQDLNVFFGGSLSVFDEDQFGYPAGLLWDGVYSNEAGSTNIQMLKICPIPGTYVCVQTVPPLDFLPQLILAGVLPDSFGFFSNANEPEARRQILQYCRLTDVNYFPIWPPLANNAVIDPAHMNLAVGNYWRLLSLSPTITRACTNGVANKAYTDNQLSPPTASWANEFPHP